MAEFKPNIYPVIYWALLYGVIAGLALFVVSVLSRFITLVWFPVFLAGLIWGGYRNYQKQRKEWARQSGAATVSGTPMAEFKAAAADIMSATRDMISEEGPAEAKPASEASQKEDTDQAEEAGGTPRPTP